jgi:HAE1 family hydrophobic/amphiphilic exporter-1
MSNLQSLIGSYYATNFIRYGQMYKVMVQADPKYRAHPEDVLKLRVKNSDGEMVPYSSFTKIKRVYGPEQLTRYNMYTSAMLNGSPAEGFSSGEALTTIEETAALTLPNGFEYEFSGMTREEILSGNQVLAIFAICLLFVYLLLAAQYESFMLPLPVLLFLPIGVFGSFFFLWIMGLQNNIYAQVAMVMLIGLLGKNAILIVEFALLKRTEGLSIRDAAIEGAKARLRPILMTSLAFCAGLIPLILASGAGSIGNQTIGAAAAGGMLFGTVFGVVVIPGLYFIFAHIDARLQNKKS